MTYKEKLAAEHPLNVNEEEYGGCYGCPSDYDYCDKDYDLCKLKCGKGREFCEECWNREIPENVEEEKSNMKIEYANLNTDTTFGDIQIGDLFITRLSNTLCVKTAFNDNMLNAHVIGRNKNTRFDKNERVIPVKKITVEVEK